MCREQQLDRLRKVAWFTFILAVILTSINHCHPVGVLS